MTTKDIEEENIRFDYFCMKQKSCNGCMKELQCHPELSPKKEKYDRKAICKEKQVQEYEDRDRRN